MKKGLILEGGAMRGMFTVGVIDVMMEHDVCYDGLVGVSAGAAFGCNYKSHQIQRALRYNKLLARDPRYMGIRSFIRTGNYISDWFTYHVVPNCYDLFDRKAFALNPMEYHLVCTDVHTGLPVYKQLSHVDYTMLEWIRASASMPLLSEPVALEGHLLLDGGISDSIPLQYFQKQGYGRNVVVLTQPLGFVKQRTRLIPLFKLLMRKYPAIIDAMAHRHEMYNAQLDYLKQEEKKGNTLLIYPEGKLSISRVETAPERLQEIYDLGRRVGEQRIQEIISFLKN